MELKTHLHIADTAGTDHLTHHLLSLHCANVFCLEVGTHDSRIMPKGWAR